MANILSIETKQNAVEYLDCAELAAIIRADLKRAFPGVKFAVRSSRFSMGTSVDVSWTDGPLTDDVNAVIGRYDCQGFDGMTDSTTNRGPVMLADGRIVRICSWLHATRKVSAALRNRVAEWFDRHFDCGWDGDKEQEINRRAWMATIVMGCLIIRKGR